MKKVQIDTRDKASAQLTCSKRLYTLKEAAEYLGRSVWGIRELIWSQVLPVVKQDKRRKMYINIKDLDDFIEKNKSIHR